MMPLPNFLIIGTAKGGTTSVWYYLRQHPEIYMADKKECHYFCAPDMKPQQKVATNPYRAIDSAEEYSGLFRDSNGEQTRGEASPLYLYYPQTAQRIAATIPDAKLVAFLRNPADRAFSAYVHMVRDGKEPLSFENALAEEQGRISGGSYHPGFFYRSWGYYFRHLQPYLEHFSRDQIRLFRFEDLKADNASVLREVCGFLGVDDSFRFDTSVKMNVSGVPRYRRLHQYITQDLEHSPFFNLLKRPLPVSWWIRSVKFVQQMNYVRPQLSPGTRSALLEDYRDDLDELQKAFDFDVSRWLDR